MKLSRIIRILKVFIPRKHYRIRKHEVIDLDGKIYVRWIPEHRDMLLMWQPYLFDQTVCSSEENARKFLEDVIRFKGKHYRDSITYEIKV